MRPDLQQQHILTQPLSSSPFTTDLGAPASSVGTPTAGVTAKEESNYFTGGGVGTPAGSTGQLSGGSTTPQVWTLNLIWLLSLCNSSKMSPYLLTY